MPARKRSRGKNAEKSEADVSEDSAKGRTSNAKKSKSRKSAKKHTKRGPVGSTGLHFVPDPSDADDTETRFVQPYEASKPYLCPGCNREIPPGMGHLVAVPRGAPDLRRHWHRGCWTNRKTRR